MESVSTTAITNSFAYDGLNRRIAVTDGRGNTSTTAYNAFGQVAYTEDAATNRTAYVYDQFGGQIETIDALNQSTYTVYDLRGRVVKQYGATYPVWYEYDVEGRMTGMATTRDTTLDPATVDSLDNPSLDVTRWNYDPATGLLVQKLYDDGKGPSYTYTPDGKLATRTWARGVVTEYAYDDVGGLASIHYSDGTLPVVKSYNRLGNPVSIIRAGTTNTFAYSATTLEKISDSQFGYAIRYGNDNLGRMETLTITNLYEGSYVYNAFGRMATALFEGLDFNYSYLRGSDLVQGLTYGSVEKTVSFGTLRDLVTGISYHNTNGVLIAERKYAYNGVGNVLSRTRQRGVDPVETDYFDHNIRSELIAASLGGTNSISGDYGYNYDPIGNRVVSTNRSEITAYTANELNQYTNIVSDAEFIPEFDNDGNQTKVKTSTGIWFIQYNAENRPVVWSNVTGVVVEMDYDHMGRRIHKKVSDDNGVKSDFWYIYDGYTQIVAIETNTVTTTFWEPTESISTFPLVIKSGGDIHTYTHDLTKNVLELLTHDGKIDSAYDYDAFGSVFATGLVQNLFQFSSETYDLELDSVYYNFRHYIPQNGRWLSRDLIETVGNNILIRKERNMLNFPSWLDPVTGVNLYLFIRNNVVCNIDLLGLACIKVDPSCTASDLAGYSYKPEHSTTLTPLPTGKTCGIDGLYLPTNGTGGCDILKVPLTGTINIKCDKSGPDVTAWWYAAPLVWARCKALEAIKGPGWCPGWYPDDDCSVPPGWPRCP